MDVKTAGNLLYQVGSTKDELGGSHYALVNGLSGGHVPTVDAQLAKKTFAALYHAINSGFVRACHDLSEGGLAVTAAEMAFAGGLGAKIRLAEVPSSVPAAERSEGFDEVLLFSESNTRFLVEVPHANRLHFEAALSEVPLAHIGEVTDSGRLQIAATPIAHRQLSAAWLVDLDLATLKEAWQKPLRW